MSASFVFQFSSIQYFSRVVGLPLFARSLILLWLCGRVELG